MSRAKARGIFFVGGGVEESRVTNSGLGSGSSAVERSDDDSFYGRLTCLLFVSICIMLKKSIINSMRPYALY